MSRFSAEGGYREPTTLAFDRSWEREEPAWWRRACWPPPGNGAASQVDRATTWATRPSEGGNWIAPEPVCVTMSRNELTILRYEYDPCCCRFKIFILINDNWETLHIMDVE